jgi:hypothetical protein
MSCCASANDKLDHAAIRLRILRDRSARIRRSCIGPGNPDAEGRIESVPRSKLGLVSIAFMLVIADLAVSPGLLSGRHINPAVTVALAVRMARRPGVPDSSVHRCHCGSIHYRRCPRL